MQRLASRKHSSLLGPYVSYYKCEVLWLWTQFTITSDEQQEQEKTL